jgi:ABC-type multidrug transport system ATPase subunit/ABC-type transporter Mla maintaining outer membrane lipid asymmetry permease subunit MlaE
MTDEQPTPAPEAPPLANADDAGLEVTGLTIRAGDRVLLENTSLRVRPGEVVLLVGGSGAGKTVFLRAVSGLIEDDGGLRSEGTVSVGGKTVRGPGREGSIGIVFQNFALLDEHDGARNVDFGADHRRPPLHPRDRRALRDRLLAELGVPGDRPIAHLSGGQKQRIAVARALAYDPPVLLFDEPTSGLDPQSAATVAALIRDAASKYGKAVLVVTHDYANLEKVGDRVVEIVPERRALEDRTGGRPSLVETPDPSHGSAAPPEPPAPAEPESPLRRFGDAVVDRLEATGRWGWRLLRALPYAAGFARWRAPAWGLRHLWHYAKLSSSIGALLYVAAAGAIIGTVSTYFSLKHMPFREITEPLVLDEMLAAIGFSQFRVLVPVVATLLIAARSGAAIAADVATRAHSHQLDALRSMGVRPEAYLLTSILWGVFLTTPLLVWASVAAARWAALIVFAGSYPHESLFAFDRSFHDLLREPGKVLWTGTGWVMAKCWTCTLGTGLLAYLLGASPKESVRDVNRAVTAAIIASTLWVLLTHFAFAFAEF